MMTETEQEENLFDKNFKNHVSEYVERARQSIPGRDSIFLIIRGLFETQLPEAAKILVVGAGGGEEIVTLGKANPRWEFTGVDLSKDMLQLAETRFVQESLVNKIELQQKEVIHLEAADFDAATCLLTLHFVEDDGAKLATLKAIKEKLKPNAPFILVDGCGLKGSPELEEKVLAWQRHAKNNGMPAELLDTIVEKSMALPMVTEEREVELLLEAGFTQPRKIYQGLHVNGWILNVN